MNKYIPLFLFILILFYFNVNFVFSGNIPQPPILNDEPIEEQHYLKKIADNFNVFEVTTSAPNGNRRGKKGEMILYNNAGTFTLWCNTDNSTTWQQI